MTYSLTGLGIAEMTFVAMNYPSVWDEIEKAFEDNQDELARAIAQRTINVHNQNLIEGC